MASYRHLKDIQSEELALDEKRSYSKKEKIGNWWHYHWKIVSVVLVVCLLAGWGIVDVVTKDKPDMVIGVLSSDFSSELAEPMAREFEKILPDINGDGKVLVLVEIYTVALTDEDLETIDPNMQMAGVTRFTVALSDSSPMIYIVPKADVETVQETYILFGTLQGKPAASADAKDIAVNWQDSSTLSAMDIPLTLIGGDVVDGQLILKNYCIGIRAYEESSLSKDKNGEEMWQYTFSFFNKITA